MISSLPTVCISQEQTGQSHHDDHIKFLWQRDLHLESFLLLYDKVQRTDLLSYFPFPSVSSLILTFSPLLLSFLSFFYFLSIPLLCPLASFLLCYHSILSFSDLSPSVPSLFCLICPSIVLSCILSSSYTSFSSSPFFSRLSVLSSSWLDETYFPSLFPSFLYLSLPNSIFSFPPLT